MPFDLKLCRLHDQATVPSYATAGSAGMDLHCCETVLLMSGTTTLVRTGWGMEIPPGYEGQVRPRSGLSTKHQLLVINSPGTIDSDFRGEVQVALYNLSEKDYVLNAGDRMAQIVFTPVTQAQIFLTSTLSDTTRGQGGFGSTGD